MATFLYYGEFQHYSYCENWIAAALDRNGHHCIRLQRTKWFDETKFLAIARQTNARIALFSKAPEVTPAQLNELKAAGLKVIFWTFDWMKHPETWSWYGPQAKVADVCFQTDGYGEQEEYKREGINRVELHQGCVPGLHDLPKVNGLGLEGFDSDLVFIGSAYTDRRHRLFEELSKHPRFNRWGEPGPQLWGNSFAAACYLSKMVIGDNFTNDVPGYWSDRVYLTLACGGFLLTAYVEGLEKEFLNHHHLVWWKSFNELHEMIDYYLPRESKRKAIALEGYRLTQERDTYDQRIQKMSRFL